MRFKAFSRLMVAAAPMFAAAACDAGSGPAAANRGDGTQEARSEASRVRSGYAAASGGRIHYRVYGDLKSRKTPLLVLHGSFMSLDEMLPFIGPLSASRPVIALDARGHGRSDEFPGETTYEDMADDAVAVLQALKLRTVDVLGYSMGGTTALFMAARHPGRVNKQVILAGTSSRSGWYPEVLRAMAQADPASFVGTPIETSYRKLSPNPEQFSTFVSEVLALEKRDYAVPDDAIRAIKGKTMVILGDADGVDLDHALDLFRMRGGGDRKAAGQGMIVGPPRARLAILPATSHVGIVSEASQIVRIAAEFLDDRPPKKLTGIFEGMDTAAGSSPK